jgi:dUTP pyrophosphatase
MKIKFKKLAPNAVTPTKAHPTDAGFDLTATSQRYDEYGASVYGTGIAVEIPDGYVGLLFPRSSIAKRDLTVANAVGVIDAGYRGEILLKFKPAAKWNFSEHAGYYYRVGERIAQLIIMPLPEVTFEEADTLEHGERGANGYGSTGL